MSQRLISHNPDLRRLRDEGYDMEVRGGHLLLKGVPYVNAQKQVKLGTLVSILTLQGDQTATPSTHVAYLVGEHPCNPDGTPIEKIRHQTTDTELEKGLIANHSFSSKPPGGYADHYDKMSTYAKILSGPARTIDPTVTAQTFPPVPTDGPESVFEYVDTASSRAGIAALNAKFNNERVGIIGLGGTGSYVLDFVAKTPVREIHLFDGDVFSQHNAFRAPGAASLEELGQRPSKVKYFHDRYSRMHRHIHAHESFVSATSIEALASMTMVFMCMDDGAAKKRVVQKLESASIPFIDAGMGLVLGEGVLTGILRVTTSTPQMRSHVHEKGRIPFHSAASDAYASNIQVADLNALNAIFAVIKWKKLLGFYADFVKEHYSTYTVDGNSLVCEDTA